MFSEILRIKPVLDSATTKQMEQNLSARFARVAHRFGQGLRAVVKGSILGISLGLISRLLNPIEALEDKIKKLLGEGTDIRELADKLGGTPGQVKQLQDVAQTLGVTPDQFKELLTKYAAAIEKGREELHNPFVEPSSGSLAVRQFVDEKNLVQGFTAFLTSLKGVGQGKGLDLPLSDRAKRIFSDAALKGQPVSEADRNDLLARGELRQRTGLETRQAFEKEIFGEAQSGATRRLIEANVPEIASKIKEPSVDRLNEAINKAASLADQKRALEVEGETADFVAATNRLNGKMIQDMAAADRLSLERETKQLQSYEDLRKASNGVEELKGLLIGLSTTATKGIGYLGDLAVFVAGLKNSRMFRGIFGSGKGGE